MSDRLTLAHALENGGMPRAAAEKIATEIYDAIHNNVATKQDLERLETALKADIAAGRADMAQIETALKADLAAGRANMAQIETALKADIRAVRADVAQLETALKADIAASRADMAHLEQRLLIRLGGLIGVVAGLASTIVHFWR